MENLEKYTPIELLKQLNNIKLEHDVVKNKIIEYTNEIDLLEKTITLELTILSDIEKRYIDLIQEINNR